MVAATLEPIEPTGVVDADCGVLGENGQQLLVCLAGSVVAEVSDGRRWRAVHLDCPDVGLYIPPMVWGAQHDYSREAVLLVLASDEYDSADYIRDIDTFRAERSRTKAS